MNWFNSLDATYVYAVILLKHTIIMMFYLSKAYKVNKHLHQLTFLHKWWETIKTLISPFHSSAGFTHHISVAHCLQFPTVQWLLEGNWSTEISSFITGSETLLFGLIFSRRWLSGFWKASVDWVTYRSVLLEPQTVSDDSVRLVNWFN